MLEHLLEEIQRLQKRSELLDTILAQYKTETMTFDIPEKWKGGRVREDKLPAKTPRHLIDKKIRETLSWEEYDTLNF